jgi:putative tryptophan/tyrosine transport system substrate-binding protein
VLRRLAAAVLLLAAAVSVQAQTARKPYRIGYLVTGGAVSFPISVEPFRRGMRELGYREGADFVLELRTAEGRNERLDPLAAELVHAKPDVIVVSTTPGAQAAMRATRVIPIVVANSSDPVGTGLVKSLARPGGNVTGLSNQGVDLGEKQLELMRSVIPGVSNVAVLVNPANPSSKLIADNVQRAADRFGVKILWLEARDVAGIEKAFATLATYKVQALIVTLDGIYIQQRRQIAEMALKHRLATMTGGSGHAEAGALMSYGPDFAENFRRAASYVDRILKGAKVGELPVEQPGKFEILINTATAKKLGLAIPRELLLRADRVVE